jgi:large subunit ribosomal protein L25
VNTLVNLSIDGKEARRVLIREYQIHPVKRTLVHVDFYDCTSDRKVLVKVPLRFLGKSEFEKQGGSRQVVLRELRVRCAPDAIPEYLDIQMDSLTAMRVRISEVPVPAGAEIVYRIDQPVVQLKNVSDEPEAGAGAAAPAEGEAAPAADKAPKKD